MFRGVECSEFIKQTEKRKVDCGEKRGFRESEKPGKMGKKGFLEYWSSGVLLEKDGIERVVICFV